MGQGMVHETRLSASDNSFLVWLWRASQGRMINKHSEPVLTAQFVYSPFDLRRQGVNLIFKETILFIAALERHISMVRGNEVDAVVQI